MTTFAENPKPCPRQDAHIAHPWDEFHGRCMIVVQQCPGVEQPDTCEHVSHVQHALRSKGRWGETATGEFEPCPGPVPATKEDPLLRAMVDDGVVADD